VNTPQVKAASGNKRIAIVGLGLIGGSFAAALKHNGFSGHISALVRTDAAAKKAIASGYVDHASTNVQSVISDADLVMLAVPMLAMRAQLELIKPFLTPACVITDAGSVKQPFVDDARAVLTDLSVVVPGHPIAGREKSGIDAVDKRLYRDKRVLLTPLDESTQAAIDLVTSLWQQCGAVVESLEVDHHDRVLAATSHLPHALAFALVDTLTSEQKREETFRYAAGEALDAFNEHIMQLREAIEKDDGDTLETVFKRAKQSRDEHFGDS